MPIFNPTRCAVFHTTKGPNGALSNMCAGFPITINGHRFRTSEALYQAARFPDHPDVQEAIRDAHSPMGAKFIGREHIAKTRPDWDEIRVHVMDWAIRRKWDQNRETFGSALLATGDKPIVEKSTKDDFWGAYERDGVLVGENVLGSLLTMLRDDLVASRTVRTEPWPGLEIVLFGEMIT